MTDAEAPLTRRERQRQATLAEIVDVSRRLVRVSPNNLSLRAVAAEMGMTAPALYRYIDGQDALQVLIGQQILQDVERVVADARAAHPDDDPALQLIAMCLAFREWALTQAEEFAVVFANVAIRNQTDQTRSAGLGFAEVFGEVFMAAHRKYSFPLQEASELEPEILEALESGREQQSLPCSFPGEPIGVVWLFLRCWARLYGIVTLEVFKHMDAPVVTSGGLYLAMFDDLAAELRFGEDWSRRRDWVREQLRTTLRSAGD